MGVHLSNPIMSNYAVALGTTVVVAGFLAGLNGSAAVLVRPVSGLLSDRLNKKLLMIVSASVMALSVFGCGFFDNIFLIAVFRILLGIAFAFKSIVLLSVVSLTSSKDSIGHNVGWFSMSHTLACAIGPLVGAAIGSALGFQYTFILAGMIICMGLILLIFFDFPVVEVKYKKKFFGSINVKYLRSFKPSRLFFLPSLNLASVTLFLMMAQSSISSLILLTGDMRGIVGSAVYFSTYAVAGLVFRPFIGKLSDTCGLTTVFLPLSFCAIFGTLILAFTAHFIGVALAGLFVGIGQSSLYTSLQAEAIRGVSKRMVGRSISTFYIGADLGIALGSFAGGAVLQWFGVLMFYIFTALLFLVATVLFFSTHRRRESENRE